MNDKTFAQAMAELNQRAYKEVTDEALHCWIILQQEGSTVASATAHIEQEHRRETVTHILFYILLQSLVHDARKRHLLTTERYEELRSYIDTLTERVRQQEVLVSPLPVN